MKERWLIVGGDGLLGGALAQHWRQRAKEVITTSRKTKTADTVLQLDLAQDPAAWPDFPECRAAVLCASVTNLEQCRRDPEGTRRVNVTHTLQLARRLADQGCFVLFVSSNLVFDGSKPLCQPGDSPCPRTEYGRQKSEVESGLAALGDRAGIVRLTKVVHPAWPLVRGWMKSLEEGKTISAFEDLVCAPITLTGTVGALAVVAERQLGGIWHLSAGADMSYAAIGRQLARQLKKDPALVRSASARDTGTLEHLPQHTTLDARRSKTELGFEIADPEVNMAQTFFA